jgi:hypothetical protein
MCSLAPERSLGFPITIDSQPLRILPARLPTALSAAWVPEKQRRQQQLIASHIGRKIGHQHRPYFAVKSKRCHITIGNRTIRIGHECGGH